MPLTRSQKRNISASAEHAPLGAELLVSVPDSAAHGEPASSGGAAATQCDFHLQPRRSMRTSKRKSLKENAGTTKKTRTLRVTKTPDDEERPTNQRPTVTPSAVSSSKRRICFPSPEPFLPEGVVNIFSNRDEMIAGDHVTCSSGTDELMRSNYRDHITVYGLQCTDLIKQQEEKEHLNPPAVVGWEEKRVLPNQPLLTIKMRRTLVSWLGEVTQEYNLSDTAYHLAITILDKVLSMGPTSEQYLRDSHLYIECLTDDEEDCDERPPVIARTDFQAYGCACLWIASKIEDRAPPRVDQLCYISDCAFSTQKLIRVESLICKLLEFRLSRTTPVHFMGVFERASHVSTAPLLPLHRYSKRSESFLLYLLQLSRFSYELVYEHPSLLCAAALYLMRATLGLQEKGVIWTPTLQYYTGYSVKDLQKTVYTLYKLQLSVEESDTIFKRFQADGRSKVSSVTPLRIEDLTDLDLVAIGVTEKDEFFDYDVLVDELV